MRSAGVTHPSATYPAFFRYREVAGSYVITNAQGDFATLTREEFKAFA